MPGIVDRLAFIADMLAEEAVALSSGEKQLTYTSLVGEVKKRIGWLRKAGSEVVALHADNSIEWVLIDLACQEMEIVFIPVPAFFTTDQVQQCIAHSGVDTLLSDLSGITDKLSGIDAEVCVYLDSVSQASVKAWKISKHHCQSFPKGTQKITFTSGSTATPKGVCLSVAQQWCVAQSLADTIAIKHPKHLCLLPLSTLLENVAGVYTALLSGGEVVMPTDRDRGILGSSQLDSKALLNCIVSTQPSTIILVPQLLTLLVQACMNSWRPPESLQFIAVGGGKVSSSIIEQARGFGLPVYQGYGLSECGSVVALNTPSSDRVDTVGHVLPHCHVSLDKGEVVVSGAVHLGYLDDPDSWYPDKIHTGDIGLVDGEFLTIDGRKKNILITSFGRNISPEWVESILMSMPLLSHCVVLGDGRPHLIALVSAPSVVSDSDIDHWVSRSNQQLPDYAKVGGWVRLSDQELNPYMTSNGRPQREKIQNEFAAQVEENYQQASQLAQIG